MLDQDDDDLSDLDLEGYESVIGWQPPYKHQKLLDDYKKKNPFINPADNMLDVRPANQWLEFTDSKPAAKPLFGDLWKEGELAIMFADTGCGKSILAVQIAECLAAGTQANAGTRASLPARVAEGDAKGSPTYEGGAAPASGDGMVLSNILKNTAPAQKVLYLDFELSSAQFMERYSRETLEGRRVGHYEFSPSLLRSEIKWDEDLPKAFKTLGDFMAHSVQRHLDETEAKILIVDNISYLNTANTNANSALALMKALKQMKSDYGASILVLAHTPKRAITKELTVNDLAGSKMLANFADNLFAIGTSIRAKDKRYLKHIKQRNCPAIYDASNVIVCRLEKPDNFPQFTFLEFDHESHHTTRPYDTTNADRTKLIAAAKDLSAKGHTQREIAEILNLGLTTVNRYLSKE